MLNAKKMSGNGGNNNRVEQPELEPGNYPARLVQVIDFGLQPQRPYKGEEKAPANIIGLTYELCDAFMVDENGDELEDKPRWISEQIPFHSLSADLAKSTKRYLALDPKQDHEGDFGALIGTPCMVTVVINKSGDKVYENISNVGPMRPRDAANLVDLKNEGKVFDLDAPDMEVFGKLPKWIQEKIASNLNFKGSALEKALGAAGDVKEDKPKADKPKAAKARQEPVDAPEEDDEDVPY